VATLADNVYQAITDFDDIRSAIIEKDQPVPAGTPTSAYANKIRDIKTSVIGWQPDTLWVKMPNMPVAGQQVIYAIVGVTENYPYMALMATTLSGQYRVDWGDGTVTTHNSSTMASRTYSFASLASDKTQDGFKTVLITITAVTAGNLRTLDFGYSLALDMRSGKTNYLFYVRGRALSLTRITFTGSGSTWSHSRFLKCVDLLDTASLTSSNAMLSYAASLCCVPQLDMSFVTNADYMFAQAFGLYTAPPLNTVRCASFVGMFSECEALVNIPTPLNLGAATNITDMFEECVALQNVRFSAISPAITNLNLAKTALSRQAIVNVFNDLPARSSGTQVINITQCPGAAQLTTQDRQIATNKRWTITS